MPKIGYIHLKVSNLKRAENFYVKILGFKVSERISNYVFLTFGESHHDLALQEIKGARIPLADTVGLYHFAIEFGDLSALADIYFKLKKSRIKFSSIDHGISKAIYFSDTDGNGVEVYVETRDKKKWHGRSIPISVKEFVKYKK